MLAILSPRSLSPNVSPAISPYPTLRVMVTGSVNCVSRKFTAARIPLVKPLGAASTLESQLMSIVNALGDVGTFARLTGGVTGVGTGVLGIWRRAAASNAPKETPEAALLAPGSPKSAFEPKNALLSQEAANASGPSNKCFSKDRTASLPNRRTGFNARLRDRLVQRPGIYHRPPK